MIVNMLMLMMMLKIMLLLMMMMIMMMMVMMMMMIMMMMMTMTMTMMTMMHEDNNDDNDGTTPRSRLYLIKPGHDMPAELGLVLTRRGAMETPGCGHVLTHGVTVWGEEGLVLLAVSPDVMSQNVL